MVEVQADLPDEGIEVQLAELAALLLDHESLEQALEHVTHIAVRAIPACDAAGVSLSEHDQFVTAAASRPLVRVVDNHQHSTREGPCVETLQTGEPRRSPALAQEHRWPNFVPKARAEGVTSCMSMPLVVGQGTAGALNMYSVSQSFQETDEELGRRFAVPASVVVANARAYAKIGELVGQLRQALETRDVIGQAKGIIRAREGSNSDEAFERLRQISQDRNIKLHDVAQRIVDTPDQMLRQDPKT